jgi:hypothetical protein
MKLRAAYVRDQARGSGGVRCHRCDELALGMGLGLNEYYLFGGSDGIVTELEAKIV